MVRKAALPRPEITVYGLSEASGIPDELKEIAVREIEGSEFIGPASGGFAGFVTVKDVPGAAAMSHAVVDGLIERGVAEGRRGASRRVGRRIRRTTQSARGGSEVHPSDAWRETPAQRSMQVMIEVESATKRYGENVAVEDLSFVVAPGIVTGFLGPNGAGKSTTMRMILGLDAPTSGSVRVNGRSYRDLTAPLHEIGAMLEAGAIHGGRSAYHHLLAMAQTHGISRARVEEVIELVGLGSVARKRAGSFSLGMGQRLGIASALLGDPDTVILDEPVNGLDPEGIRWIRTLLKDLAAAGRTVFLSSHLMSEMAVTAEHLVVVGRGRLIADTTVEAVVAEASADAAVHVRTPQEPALRAALEGPEVRITSAEPGVVEVRGLPVERIGELASAGGIVLHELTPHRASLEEAYMRLTGDSVQYRTSTSTRPDAADARELVA